MNMHTHAGLGAHLTAPASALAGFGRPGPNISVDPIHDAIAKCRSALDAYMDAVRDDAGGNGETPEVKATGDAYSDAWKAVLSTQPATINGVSALARFAITLSDEMSAWDYQEEALEALAGWEA